MNLFILKTLLKSALIYIRIIEFIKIFSFDKFKVFEEFMMIQNHLHVSTKKSQIYVQLLFINNEKDLLLK